MPIRYPCRRFGALVAAGALLVVVAPRASAQLPVPTAPPTASVPGCHTEDASGQPATLFAPGDRIVVKGEGFGFVSAIRVTFVQGSRTLSVTTAVSDELGTFTADSEDAKIPTTGAPGPAEIHAFNTARVAKCAVQVMAAAGGSGATPAPEERRSPLLLVWLAALAAFGLFLLVVVIRRWRARRLASKVQAPDVPRLPDEAAQTLSPAPLFVEPPPLEQSYENRPDEIELEERPAEPVRPETVSVLDLIPEPDETPAPAAPQPASPEPRVRESDATSDIDEFVFRDGKWRLRDELEWANGHEPPVEWRPARVDVVEARDVADALRVPRIDRDAAEPPLLDPVDVEPPEWWSDRPRTAPEEIEGTVSDTVARLVENTKDWTKR